LSPHSLTTRGGSDALALAQPEAKRRWNDLGKRVASAVVMLPLALGCLWFGGLPFAALVVLVGLGLAVEWVQLCRDEIASIPAVFVPTGVVGATVLAALGLYGLAMAVAVVAALAILLVPSNDKIRLAAGLPYFVPASLALLWLRSDQVVGFTNLLVLLVIIWSNDIGAYLVGRLVGGPRLAPAISPGKTWSGAVGGLLCGVAVGLGIAAITHGSVAPLRLFALSVVLGIVSQVGDLFESMLKRHFGVKDSGRLIPGHGGLLDRLDGLLAVAPIAAMLVLATGRGVVLW
jgi:phosphatidate cytidylyltransferase